jgi:protein TonB
MKHILIISFLLIAFVNSNAQETKEEEPLQWFQVQTKAEFPGGEAAFDKYIVSNFNISKKASKKAKSGTILVTFIVEKDGSITDVNVTGTNKLGYGLEEEAIRIIKQMPKWKPAMQRGKPVRMSFRKPIRLTF